VWVARFRPLTDEQMAWRLALMLDQDVSPRAVNARLKDWRLRWPRLDVYPCGALRCDGIVIGGAGLCRKHGKPPIVLGKSHELFLLVSDSYIPLGDLFHGGEAAYKDGNPWNAHPSNLKDYGED